MTQTSERVHVLVVDDSEDQRLLLRRHFERAGCEVVEAGTAIDALDRFNTQVPDLTVIDLVLPGMDGWALADVLSSTSSAIAISSVMDREHYPVQHAAIPKPVSGATIRAALEQLVPRWNAA
jgi:CheY-like chemotaxis protein